MDKKAQACSTNIIYLIVGFILLIAIGIPLTQKVIVTANITGLPAQILVYVPVFVAIEGLILAIMVSGIKV